MSDSDESRVAGNWPAITEISGSVTCKLATHPLVGKTNFKGMHSSSNICTEQLKSFPAAEMYL